MKNARTADLPTTSTTKNAYKTNEKLPTAADYRRLRPRKTQKPLLEMLENAYKMNENCTCAATEAARYDIIVGHGRNAPKLHTLIAPNCCRSNNMCDNSSNMLLQRHHTGVIQMSSRRHPGVIQVSSRRHPGVIQASSRRHPGIILTNPEGGNRPR